MGSRRHVTSWTDVWAGRMESAGASAGGTLPPPRDLPAWIAADLEHRRNHRGRQDLEVVAQLGRYRYLTSDHIAAIYGDLTPATRGKRLNALVDRFWLCKRVRKDLTLYWLGPVGLSYCQTQNPQRRIGWRNQLTLDPATDALLSHWLGQADVGIGAQYLMPHAYPGIVVEAVDLELSFPFTQGGRRPGSPRAGRAWRPDGRMVIGTPGGQLTVFWEFDRGTEAASTFRTHKAEAAAAYAEVGGRHLPLGEEYWVFTETKPRRNALAAAVLGPRHIGLADTERQWQPLGDGSLWRWWLLEDWRAGRYQGGRMVPWPQDLLQRRADSLKDHWGRALQTANVGFNHRG
jgi:hypothetical protein